MCSIKKDPFVYSYTNPKWAMDVLSGSGFQRTSLLLFPDPSFIIIFWVFLHNFIFFASLYFSLFQYVDLYNQLGNGMTPPPPLLEKFPNNHVDQDQGGSMSRNTFNTWSAVRTKQPTV